MGLIRCPNGHMFSERRYGTICPYCNVDTKKMQENNNTEKQVQDEKSFISRSGACMWLACLY